MIKVCDNIIPISDHPASPKSILKVVIDDVKNIKSILIIVHKKEAGSIALWSQMSMQELCFLKICLDVLIQKEVEKTGIK